MVIQFTINQIIHLYLKKIESLQYNTALAITGAIKGSSKEELYYEYQELYQSNLPISMICYFHYKVLKESMVSFSHCCVELKVSFTVELNFKNSFLLYTINEWNKLYPETRRIDTQVGFRKKLPSFIKPTQNKTFSIYDALGIKLPNRLRVDFSHLNEHKFRYNFIDTLYPLFLCCLETGSMAHFFLRCRNYNDICITLINELNGIDISITSRHQMNYFK